MADLIVPPTKPDEPSTYIGDGNEGQIYIGKAIIYLADMIRHLLESKK